MCVLRYYFCGQLSPELKGIRGSVNILIHFSTETTVQSVFPEWLFKFVDASSFADVPQLFHPELLVGKHRLAIFLKHENKLPLY